MLVRRANATARPSGIPRIGSAFANGLISLLPLGATGLVDLTGRSWTQSGTVDWSPEHVHLASGAYLQTADADAFDGPAFSFSAWVWMDSPSTGLWRTVVAHDYYGFRVLIGSNFGSYDMLAQYGNSASGSSSSVSNQMDGWHHVAYAGSASGQTVYLDGRQYGTGSAASFTSAGAVSLGGRSAGSLHLIGRLRDVAMWNRALSPAEVWTLHAPQTRWSLYAPRLVRTYLDVAAAPGGTVEQSLLLALRWQIATGDTPTPISCADALGISVADAAALIAALYGTDAPALGLTDAPTLAAALSGADAPTLSLTDVGALVAALSGTDATGLSLTDVASLTSALSGSDAVTLSLTESAALVAALAAAETLGISVADVATLAVALAANDTVAAAVTESGSVDTSNQVTGTDSVALSLADSAALLAALTGTETAGVSLADVASLAATRSATDTASVAVTDSAAVDSSNQVTGTDSAAVAITDSASAPTVALSSADAPTLSLADVATLAAALTASDALGITLVDVASLYATEFKSGSDTAAVAVQELAAIAAALASSGDIVQVALEDVPGLAALLGTDDSLVLAVTDTLKLVIDGRDIAARVIALTGSRQRASVSGSRQRASVSGSRTRGTLPGSRRRDH